MNNYTQNSSNKFCFFIFVKNRTMKKILTFLILLSLSFSVYSQEPSMKKGRVVLYLGVGAGSGWFGAGKYKGVGYSYSASPIMNFGFEYGFSEAIPKSILGLGANVSMAFYSWNYHDSKGYGWNEKWSDITVLAKGYYHHTFLVGEKWDVYGSPLLGLRFRTHTYSYDPGYYYNNSTYSGVSPAIGVAIGGRYYVSKVFGFFAEVSQGYNVDYAKIGFAFKL